MLFKKLCGRKSKTELEQSDYMAIAFWRLHELYGFGEMRLKRLYDSFDGKFNKDEAKLCSEKLKELGVDINEWC